MEGWSLNCSIVTFCSLARRPRLHLSVPTDTRLSSSLALSVSSFISTVDNVETEVTQSDIIVEMITAALVVAPKRLFLCLFDMGWSLKRIRFLCSNMCFLIEDTEHLWPY